MFVALDKDYHLVDVKQGIEKSIFYCPCCLEPVHFVRSQKKVWYFRHNKLIGEKKRQECELFSSNLSFSYEIDLEEECNRKIRLQLHRGDKTHFSLLFPKLTKGQTLRQEDNKSYFHVTIEETKQQISSVNLMHNCETNFLPVSLCDSYTISISEEVIDNAITEIYQGGYYPLQKPALFKPIAGRIIHIPYVDITIQDEFYILSRQMLFFAQDIHVLETEKLNTFTLYKCVMNDAFSTDCISWFKRVLSKNLLPSSYHLDVIKPVKFIRGDGLFQIQQANLELNLAFTGKQNEQQLLKIKHPNEQITYQKVTPGIVKLQLPQYGIYQISVALQRGPWLTINQVKKLTTFDVVSPSWLINNEEVIFRQNIIKGEQFVTKSVFPICYYSGSTKSHGKKTVFDFKEEMVASIPYLWSVKLRKPKLDIKLDFQELLFFYKTQAELVKVDSVTYQSILARIEASKHRQLLTFVRSYPNMIPKRFIDR
ncbi:hypothetical protein [Neobacillus massiliamazoniensis]|uniref:Uncharacterized protein n=1 Tax=Neobacillus massiliamazoniensis TaxID=1499688 RepID=A0A0U1NYA1_9BACI|nr:hypothetical protein [Neobacillus massiliamazoniensis]CRK83009.1 hypothetical protein BN000_02964 [Neobacillus massiliamazoniensis]